MLRVDTTYLTNLAHKKELSKKRKMKKKPDGSKPGRKKKPGATEVRPLQWQHDTTKHYHAIATHLTDTTTNTTMITSPFSPHN